MEKNNDNNKQKEKEKDKEEKKENEEKRQKMIVDFPIFFLKNKMINQNMMKKKIYSPPKFS